MIAFQLIRPKMYEPFYLNFSTQSHLYPFLRVSTYILYELFTNILWLIQVRYEINLYNTGRHDDYEFHLL